MSQNKRTQKGGDNTQQWEWGRTHLWNYDILTRRVLTHARSGGEYTHSGGDHTHTPWEITQSQWNDNDDTHPGSDEAHARE